jgi:hypothetical protein
MGRTSDHIHFPRHVERIPRRTNGPSGYSDSLGRAVLIDIINYFADVVDAIEDIKLPKQHKDRTKLKNEKKKLCDTVVRGANTFSALFNTAKGQTKYTDLARMSLPIRPYQSPPANIMCSQELATLPGRDQQSTALPTIESQVKPWPIILLHPVPTKAHGHLERYRDRDMLVAQDPSPRHRL